MSALKNALLTLMTLAMLFALALATPLGSLTENAPAPPSMDGG